MFCGAAVSFIIIFDFETAPSAGQKNPNVFIIGKSFDRGFVANIDPKLRGQKILTTLAKKQ